MYNRKALPTLMTVITCLAAVFLLAACSGDSEFKGPSTLCETNTSAEEETMTTENTHERILEVVQKYDALFMRQPNVHGWGPSTLRDENGERTGPEGIVIRATKKVDQDTLPVEDRIPDCLDGVPVQIIESEPFILEGEEN